MKCFPFHGMEVYVSVMQKACLVSKHVLQGKSKEDKYSNRLINWGVIEGFFPWFQKQEISPHLGRKR